MIPVWMQKAPSAPRPPNHKAHTMSLFIPPNQLQNMIDAEVGQALCGRADIGKLVALSALQHSPQQQHMQQSDSWLDDNWLDDNWL